MDDMARADMTEDEIEKYKKFFEELTNVLHNLSKNLNEWFNSLPPFLKFEILHPRKKPRGSIRRVRKERRNDRNNQLSEKVY